MSTNYSTDVITSGSMDDTITIDSIMNSTMSSTLNYSITNSGTSGTSGTGAGTFYYTNNTAPWITASPTPNTLDVQGDANFQGDIKFKGRSLEQLFAKIEDRLAILQPDPTKLEKYEALRKAYDHYKLLEKLIHED